MGYVIFSVIVTGLIYPIQVMNDQYFIDQGDQGS